MAVETATELSIFFDTDDFGVAATYTPSGGSAATVNGIFDNAFFEVQSGGEVSVAMEQPTFVCRTSDVPSAAEGDALTVNAVAHTVRVVQVDGVGTTTLILEQN